MDRKALQLLMDQQKAAQSGGQPVNNQLVDNQPPAPQPDLPQAVSPTQPGTSVAPDGLSYYQGRDINELGRFAPWAGGLLLLFLASITVDWLFLEFPPIVINVFGLIVKFNMMQLWYLALMTGLIFFSIRVIWPGVLRRVWFKFGWVSIIGLLGVIIPLSQIDLMFAPFIIVLVIAALWHFFFRKQKWQGQ